MVSWFQILVQLSSFFSPWKGCFRQYLEFTFILFSRIYKSKSFKLDCRSKWGSQINAERLQLPIIMSAVRIESESVWKSDKDLVNPIVTCLIKKRINTELFIGEKHELYKHKMRIKNSWSDLSERDTNSWLERLNMQQCLKRLKLFKRVKISQSEMRCKTNHWAYVMIKISEKYPSKKINL